MGNHIASGKVFNRRQLDAPRVRSLRRNYDSGNIHVFMEGGGSDIKTSVWV